MGRGGEFGSIGDRCRARQGQMQKVLKEAHLSCTVEWCGVVAVQYTVQCCWDGMGWDGECFYGDTSWSLLCIMYIDTFMYAKQCISEPGEQVGRH